MICLRRKATCLLVALALLCMTMLFTHVSRRESLPTCDARPESMDHSYMFLRDWSRVRKHRMDWKELLKPCNGNLSWESKIWDKRLRTNGALSFIARWELQTAGLFSRFFIQSVKSDGRAQSNGGDSWRVKISGTAHVAVSVFDHDNGLYKVVFLPMESGEYKAEIILDYSLCDGYRDPPLDWFIKGNSQGKHQPEGTLGTLDDYLLEPLQNGKPIKFNIASTNGSSSLTDSQDTLPLQSHVSTETSGQTTCRFLWDGYGRWLGRTWKPYLPGLLVPPHYRDFSKGKGLLWSYGDSLNFNNYRYNFNTSKLCKDMFDRCSYNINFVYHIKYRIELDTTETDDMDFNATRVIEHFRSVLLHPDINHINSVIFLNMGLHYVMGLTLERYQDLIQRTIDLIKETEVDSRGTVVRKFKGHVIWKTTTAINKQKAKSLQATKWRFCTYPRVGLFNAYATSAMCKAGIDIADMYHITDTYPDGTYDVVHYRPPASQPLVPVLINYLRQESDAEVPYEKLDT